ncbi:MAG: hypothetical protein HY362_03900 [Candidatus Aenigmarchaeota archaeon]|nr:hypothetical protein [Candidatus Aenigmarchaeota archaeon]
MELKKIELFVLFFFVGLIEDIIAVFVSGGKLSFEVLAIIAILAILFSFIEEYVEHFYILKDWIKRKRMIARWKKYSTKKTNA